MAATRTVTVSTPLGDDALLLARMHGTEQLGRLFEFELDLLSEDEQISFEDVLGQSVTVNLDLPDDKKRYFNGYASRFCQVGRQGRYALYRATLRPWFWFLTRTADCRIFQEMTVPDILKDVFREHGFTDFEESLTGSYRTWEYCVQYRETDFNFLSRLMEQEGIYYYFKHDNSKHTLVLSDSYSSHDLLPGAGTIPYFPPSENAVRQGHIFDWSISKEIQPGKYAMTDYDFERPRADLSVSQPFPRSHDKSEFEVYDYPGEYLQDGDGQTYARLRIEEHQAQYERVEGQGTDRCLAVGGLFQLSEYPRTDQNREYLIVSAVHEITVSDYESGPSAADTEPYTCGFTAVDSQQPYRAVRSTPKPVVQGPQTAVVVGKSGEEIWTDKHGRVKVQFHWDRAGKSDENSSCWVRVAQNWAGKRWGGMYVPHVGHEVIISFLEGDPDRPIITGRVYNADNMPPQELPAHSTQSVWSDHGGNHIRMEGAQGSEQIHMFSPYGNSKLWIGAPNQGEGIGLKTDLDLKVTVDRDWVTNVTQDAEINVLRNRLETVRGDLQQQITGKVTQEARSNWDIICHGEKVEKVYGPVKLKYDGVGIKIHGGVVSDTFLGAKHTAVIGAEIKTNLSYVLEASYSGGKSYKNVSSRTIIDSTEKTEVIGGGGKANISSILLTGDFNKLKSGEATIIIMKDGDISIDTPKDIKLSSDGNINLDAGGDVTIKCKKFDYSKAKSVEGLDQSNK